MPEPRSLQIGKNSFSAVVDAVLHGRPQTVTIDHLLSMPQGDAEFERRPVTPREVEFGFRHFEPTGVALVDPFE